MAVEREKFSAEELAICLSRYDLGEVRKVEPFVRGSKHAPKLIIECDRGKLLFKRRPRGRADLQRVAFTHRLQLFLAAQNYPLPHLIGTRRDNNSMLVIDGVVYEMFEYIDGTGYRGGLGATYHAGHVLGLYHKLTCDYQPEGSLVAGSYHNAKAIRQAIEEVVRSLPVEQRPTAEELSETIEDLSKHYRQCAVAADGLGLRDWPKQMSHGDWHAGNMLFREEHVVAVIDYDTARLQRRVIDLANGALQFSILGGSGDPGKWPAQLDMSRLKRFLRGYDSVEVITEAEMAAVPYLMCEAMIAEAVLPIAATGSFGRMQGFPFLRMIQRKVHWVLRHRDDIVATLEE